MGRVKATSSKPHKLCVVVSGGAEGRRGRGEVIAQSPIHPAKLMGQTTRRAMFAGLGISISLGVWLSSHWGSVVIALPPPEDTPEEVLRTEIIIDARSPIDGKPVSAAEYIEIQAQLQKVPPPKLDPKIRQNVFLLRIRNALRQFFPFLDF
jgi:hypothetical protein